MIDECVCGKTSKKGKMIMIYVINLIVSLFDNVLQERIIVIIITNMC